MQRRADGERDESTRGAPTPIRPQTDDEHEARGILPPTSSPSMERMEEDVALAKFQIQIYQKRRDTMIGNMNRRFMDRKSMLDADMHDPSGAYSSEKQTTTAQRGLDPSTNVALYV